MLGALEIPGGDGREVMQCEVGEIGSCSDIYRVVRLKETEGSIVFHSGNPNISWKIQVCNLFSKYFRQENLHYLSLHMQSIFCSGLGLHNS